MAYYYPEPSHTFSEYLLVPGYTSPECVPSNVSLRTPLVKFPLASFRLVPSGAVTRRSKGVMNSPTLVSGSMPSLPIISQDGRLLYFVFRKDYEQHKENPGELLDSHKHKITCIVRCKCIFTAFHKIKYLIHNNTALVDEEPTSWNVIWDEQYKDKVLMFNNSRDAITSYETPPPESFEYIFSFDS